MRLLYCAVFLIVGCTIGNNGKDFRNTKNEFDLVYTSHFPDTLIGVERRIVLSKNTENHDVGLLVYEYDLPSEFIEQQVRYFKNRSVAVYTPTDTCLIIVNRFETLESIQNRTIVKVDTALVNEKSKCEKFPVPNFIDVRSPELDNELKLNKDYTLYVLESKSGVFDINFQKKASPQMPEKWKNGFTRGVAINEKERSIVYWFVMW